MTMEKSIYSEEYLVFLQILQESRKAAGLTQGDVAGRLGQGVTQSFVSKCERGERRIDIVELRAFCKAFDLAFDSFVIELEERLRGGMGARDGYRDAPHIGSLRPADEFAGESHAHGGPQMRRRPKP